MANPKTKKKQNKTKQKPNKKRTKRAQHKANSI